MLKILLRCVASIIFLTGCANLSAGTIDLLETLLTQTGGTWQAIADDNSTYRLVFTAPPTNSNIGSISITRTTTIPTVQSAIGSWIIVKVNNREKYLFNSNITSSSIPAIATGAYSMEIRTLGKIRLTFKDTLTGVHYRFFKVTTT